MDIKRTDGSPQIIKPGEASKTEESKENQELRKFVDSFDESKSGGVAKNDSSDAQLENKQGPGQFTSGILTKGLLHARLGAGGIKIEGSSKIAMKKADMKPIAISSERNEQINHIRSLMGELTQELRAGNISSRTGNNLRENYSHRKEDEGITIDGIVNINPGNPLEDLNPADLIKETPPKSENSEKKEEFTREVHNFRESQHPDPTSKAQQEQLDRIRSLFHEVNQELQFHRNPTTSDNSVKQNQFSEDAAKFPETVAEAEAKAKAAKEQEALLDAFGDFLDIPRDNFSDGSNPLDRFEFKPKLVSSENSDQKAEFTEAAADFQSTQNPAPISPDLDRIQKLLTELLQSAKKLRSTE